MADFYADNHPNFFPLAGHKITWPRGAQQAWPGDAVPQMNEVAHLQGHQVESIITGEAYFRQLLAEMNYLLDANQGGIFWVHGWYFDLYQYKTIMRFWGKAALPAAFEPAETTDWALYRDGNGLKLGRSQATFVSKLIALEQAGVDVRIIGYTSPLLLQSRALLKATDGLDGTETINGIDYDVPGNVQDRVYATFYNLLRLRGDLADPKRVIFNTLNHPLGGAHSKMVIIGNANYRKAFSGGIDIAADRNKAGNHDVAICVEGKAATMAGEFFKDLWNEITSKVPVKIEFKAVNAQTGADEVARAEYQTHLNAHLTTELTDILPLQANDPADKYVQMFRTLPRKHYYASTPTLKGAAAGKVFSSRLNLSLNQGWNIVNALRGIDYFYTKPISFAQKGCYEFKTVCYKAVDAARDFIWILDQDATNYELMTRINQRIRKLRSEGHILRVIIGTPFMTRAKVSSGSPFLGDCTASKQHELFKRLSESIPEPNHSQHFLFAHVVTHAKIVLVDDKWVAIGSANCMRRSFYTDIEMGFSILHETWVRDFRKQLYDSLMDSSAPAAGDDWYHDFAAWGSDWQVDFPGVDFSGYYANPDVLQAAATPAPGTFDNSFDKTRHNFEDPDSNSQI